MYEIFRQRVVELMEGTDRDAALAAMDAAAAGFEFRQKAAGDQLPEALEEYLRCKALEGLAAGTLGNYRLALSNFLAEVRKPVEDVTTADVREYICGYQQRRGVTNRTLDKVRAMIGVFFRWAHEEGRIPRNPCAAM